MWIKTETVLDYQNEFQNEFHYPSIAKNEFDQGMPQSQVTDIFVRS